MSADGALTMLWGDGEFRFRLAIGQLRELQEKANAGPPELFERLRTNTWRVDDIRETLRLGLIGGGMSPTDALTKVIRYVDARPLFENVGPALNVLGAALLGVPDDQPAGKEQPERPQDGSASPSSMELEP